MSQKTEKPIKAFSVQDEERGVVVFATSGIAARRIGANELNTDFEAIESCRRLPWADQYASAGSVPPLVLIDYGWWFECSHCGVKVCSDSADYDKEGDNDIPHEPVAVGEAVYCKPECRDAELKERAEQKAKKEAAKLAAEKKFPGIDVRYVSDTDPAYVLFTFPGGTYNTQWTVGDDTVTVSQVDEAAWREYKVTRLLGGTA